MAQLDIEATKLALSYQWIHHQPFDDKEKVGLKYASCSFRRYFFREPTHQYFWFGTLSSDKVSITKYYEDMDGNQEKEEVSALMLTSHAEISLNLKTGMWCLCYLAVHTDYQGKGLAGKLVEDIVAFCKENNIKHIQRTRPSDEGKLKLESKIDTALTQNQIEFSMYQ